MKLLSNLCFFLFAVRPLINLQPQPHVYVHVTIHILYAAVNRKYALFSSLDSLFTQTHTLSPSRKVSIGSGEFLTV